MKNEWQEYNGKMIKKYRAEFLKSYKELCLKIKEIYIKGFFDEYIDNCDGFKIVRIYSGKRNLNDSAQEIVDICGYEME